MKKNGIRHVVIDMQGTKKVEIPQAIMHAVMEVALNKENHPLLIHCNHGKVCDPSRRHTRETIADSSVASHWLRRSCDPACSWLDSRLDRPRVSRLRRTQGSRL
jgi:hypothetical protein